MSYLESPDDRILQEDLEVIADSRLPFEKLKNASVLVTGATGLVGVSLVRALLCINRKRHLNIQILAMIRNREKAEKIYGDLLKREELKMIVGDINQKIEIEECVDYIIHCASVTASKMMVSQPVETLITSVGGTKNLLDLASEKNAQSFVYVSSMEMYGSFEQADQDHREGSGVYRSIEDSQ